MERSSCLWINRINIVKITIVLKVIYRYNATPSNSLCYSSQKQTKKNPKIHRDHKRPQISKVILSKTSNTENITIGDVK
jgi:hypothetical protein